MEQKGIIEFYQSMENEIIWTKLIETTIIILIILVAVAFYPNCITVFIPVKKMVVEILVSIGLMFWGFKIITHKKKGFIYSSLNLPVLSFILICVLSLLWSTNIFSSIRELPLFLAGPLLYFLVINNINNRKQINKIINALILIGTLLGIYGIFQYFGIDFSIFESAKGRQQVFGLFGNVNYFAEYLIIPIPIAIPLFLVNKNKIKKVLLLIAILTMSISLLFTFTRSSYLGFGVSLILMFFLYTIQWRQKFIKNKKKIVIVILLLAAIGTIVFSLPNPFNKPGTIINKIKSRISPTQLTQDSSIKRRLATWQFTILMIKDHPVFGSGIGTYKYNTLRYQAEFFSKNNNRSIYPHGFAQEAHNEYLQIWAEMGIVGLSIFIWVIFSYFKYGLKALKKNEDKYKQGMIIGLMGAVIAVLGDSIFGFPLHLPATVMMFWLAFGLTVSQSITDSDFQENPQIFNNILKIKNNQKRKGNKTRKEIAIERETNKKNRLYKIIFLKIFFALIIFFLTVFLTINAIRPFIARTYWFHADKEKNRNDIGLTEMVNNYRKALKWDPYLGEVYYDIAFLLMQNGLWTPALEYFKEAEKYVNLPALPLVIARMYINKGLLEEGAAKLKQAIPYQSNEQSIPPLYTELGDIYLRLKRYKDAESAYKDALKINSDSLSGHYGLARAFLNQKIFDKAVEEFQKVIELSPDSLESKYSRKVIQQLLEDKDDKVEKE